MDITLSQTSGIPAYQQVKDGICEKIASGQWSLNDMIPSENQCVAELGVSRMTINRALRELTDQGVLRRVHGLGTFVAEPPRQANLIELRSIADEIAAQGKVHRARVLSLTGEVADVETGRKMEMKPGSRLFRIQLVHYQDEVPIQLETRLVNPSQVPGFMEVDFTITTPTAYLVGEIRPDELEHVVQAIVPDEFVAKHLDISNTEPCLRLNRRTWKDGEVVTSVVMIYPSSRYDLGARYQPAH